MAKRATLTDFTAKKPGADTPAATVRPSPEGVAGEERKGQTLRLTPTAWRQLKGIAVAEDTTSHALLIEAVNDLFRKRGKAPIA